MMKRHWKQGHALTLTNIDFALMRDACDCNRWRELVNQTSLTPIANEYGKRKFQYLEQVHFVNILVNPYYHVTNIVIV
jgi:hypothetical protein